MEAERSFLDEVRDTWMEAVRAFERPSLARSLGQLATSVIPYLALTALAYVLCGISWWLALPVDLLAAAFMVRVFIVFHDCGHGSFFASPLANHIVGSITGVLTFTPYFEWRAEHARHHATAGDLDRRGFGDVWTMTLAEYRGAPLGCKLRYRLYRNPLVLLGVGPLFVFLLKNRRPTPGTETRRRLSVHLTNLALVAIFTPLIATFGMGRVVAVQLPIIAVAGIAGVWLFYVQHQFEAVYWARRQTRDIVAVAMQGSSFYDLPGVLQFFSGNIGYHHIHHLSPAIPNYFLPKCFRQRPIFQKVDRLTLWSSLKTLALRLYDEDAGRLVGFPHAG
jgi:acyl-lipid omega-6 desaturase (Delta-12 desaturase)